MATLQVIYQIAADISKLESGVTRGAASLQRLETGFDRVSSIAGKIGPMLAGAFTVQAVASFAGEVLELGGHLTDLRDKTGISVEGLQQLKMAADLSGNTIKQVTDAVSQMQYRLASGDRSAVGAIDALGVSLTSFMALKPDQQFREIARGIAAIEDPAERTRVAMALFGRSGAELLPLLVSDIDAVADATTVMSTETAEALDRAGDAWTAFTNNAKAAAAGIIAVLLPATKEETRALQHMADVVDGLEQFDARLLGAPTVGSGLPRAAPLSVPGLPTPEVMRESDVALRRLEESNRALIASQRESARQHAEMVSRFSRVDLEVWKVSDSVQGLGQDWSDLREVMIPTKTGFDAFDRVLRTMGETTIPTLDSEMDRLGNTLGDYGPTLDQLGFKTKGVGDYLSQVESILNGVQTAWAQMVTVAVRGIRAIAQNLAEGDWIGAIVSGVTAFGTAIANAFRDEQWERVNDMRDAFQRTFGTFDDMARAAQRAGYQIERLLDTKRVEDFEREMRAMTDAIQFQEDAMQFLDDTVKKYGFTLEELGPALQQQRLDEQAQLLFKEFKALTAAGISMDTVLLRMGDSINEFVQNALATGTEIPAAMAPMLQRMVEMGRLTDENGNVITDLEAAGVRFSMTMSEGFQALIEEVGKLTAAIERGLGGAIRNLPPIDVPVNRVNVGGIDLPLPIEPMAAGGSGRVTRPTLFMAGEAGPEEFAFSGANRSFGGDGIIQINLTSVLDDRVVAQSVSRHQARDLMTRSRLRAA